LTNNRTTSYGYSKLANIWFTIELQKRLGDSGATAYSLHPGSVQTNLARGIPFIGRISTIPQLQSITSVFFKTPREGAQTSIYCATQPTAVPGEYHADCQRVATTALADDPERARELWDWSEQLVS